MKAARRVIAGFFVGYGFVSFVYFMVLDQFWVRAGPRQPNPAFGLIFPHNEHGSYTYFTQFQTTTCALMFATSIPVAILGVLLAPKKNLTGTVRWYAASFKWDDDDPRGLMKWTALATAVATPFLICLIGSLIVQSLNTAGIVLKFD
jgi:hypothetical protein